MQFHAAFESECTVIHSQGLVERDLKRRSSDAECFVHIPGTA